MALDVATLPLILYRKVYIYPLSMYYIARTSYTFLPCFITLPFLLHFFISNVFSTCTYRLSLKGFFPPKYLVTPAFRENLVTVHSQNFPTVPRWKNFVRKFFLGKPPPLVTCSWLCAEFSAYIGT